MQLRDIEVGAIAPNDYNFNQMAAGQLKALAATVKAQGFVVHPIIVRPAAEGRFTIVDGEHQWRAAREAGFVSVPCQVLDMDEATAITETYRRNGLRGEENKVKLARAITRLQGILNEAGRTQDASNVQVAKSCGRTESWIRKVLPYGELADAVATPRPDIKGFPTNDKDIASLTYEQVVEFLKLAAEPVPAPLPLEGGEGEAPQAEPIDPEAEAKKAAEEKAEKAEAKALNALLALSPEARQRIQKRLVAIIKSDREKVATGTGENA